MDFVKNLRKIVGTRPLILPGSVVIILNDQDELLLQHRNDGSWGLVGGLMELGESMEETARREVKEESGLEIGKMTLIDVISGPDYYLKLENGDELYSVTAVYASKEVSGEIEIDQSESRNMKYFKADQLPDNMIDEYRHCLDSYFQKARLR
ncbi:NUDIX hydrolase [Falsibacillus albus]|uniref:NUDIX domain-containing protein n=1 Tax=Falsibacillus albus TaxID=2478915 RepID=A0A3L7JNM7_9BACI|nr:NUDIX hydrolase [Falsibacillus albus]RLQ92296.1 NUDIX domain-containing protein [Falsibacillus albus]